MKKLFLLPLLLLTSNTSLAKNPEKIPDILQLQGPYNVTIEQAQKSVVNLYVPEYGAAAVDITGPDKFISYTKNSTRLKVEIKSKGKIATIQSSLDPKQISTISLETECGRSIAVKIIGLSTKSDPSKIRPKLLATATSC
ncbi:hypothetical protein [Pseudoalteromonas sp. S983]|uniref:hypothetical protein n=1 Tax=Pseudoalteromonas sp. S983 TaxID=579572 RepID=UPI00110B7835|nr:hypothetical protein [Pseudoalteromonas sp. S983]TMP77689.1 hypothetical protein CWB71_19270 [Pseudoalteromonas sp. S983]